MMSKPCPRTIAGPFPGRVRGASRCDTFAQTPAVGSYLLGWAANATMERAVARALSGAAIGGRLPIRVPPALPVGAGLDRPAVGRFAE